MTSIDLDKLDIGQLADLLGNAQAEMAAREKQNRKELRTELEHRVAAEGYQLIVDERGIDVAAFKSIPMYRIHAAD